MLENEQIRRIKNSGVPQINVDIPFPESKDMLKSP
jgi:hypothetical protein